MPDFIFDDLMQFFNHQPRELALGQAFIRQVLDACPDTHIRVQKTQVTLGNRHGFAFVSLPRRKVGAPVIVVTFGLSHRLASPRIWQAVEPYPNRWTHYVLVSDESRLDDELLGWVREAAAFAATK